MQESIPNEIWLQKLSWQERQKLHHVVDSIWDTIQLQPMVHRAHIEDLPVTTLANLSNRRKKS